MPPSPILFRHRKRTKRDNLSLLQFCQNRLGRFLKMEGGLHFLKSSAGLEENYYAALRRHSFRKRLLLRYTMASFQSSSAKIVQARPPAGGQWLVAPAGLIKKWQSGHWGLPAEVGNCAACPRPPESLQAIAASTTRPHSLLFQWAFSVKARYIREYLLILQLCISMPTLYFIYIQMKIYNFVGIKPNYSSIYLPEKFYQ